MLTTKEKVKAFKNLDTGVTTHDEEITRLIPVVQTFMEEYCGRKFEQATITEYHSARAGQTLLIVRQPPVASVTSIHDDPERAYGAATLIAATEYVVTDAEAGFIQLDGWSLLGGFNNVKIVYLGGYAPTRSELKALEHFQDTTKRYLFGEVEVTVW